MKLNIFAFKDNALGCYTQPFYNDVPAENVAVGITRAITGADPLKRGVYKHKVLFKLGMFDDSIGKFIECDHELVLDAGTNVFTILKSCLPSPVLITSATSLYSIISLDLKV